MANYRCSVRTNYFHVKDEEGFREMMSHVRGCEDDVKLWEKKDDNGNTMFAFGSYGDIYGLIGADGEDEEGYYESFIKQIQAFVEDEDAIILFESGNEKLRYLTAFATIITSKKCDYLNIESLAVKRAGEMLNNPLWETQCAY